VSVAIEDVPPTAPANLREGGDGLQWDASTDNSGTIAGYSVFVDNGASPLFATTRLTAPLQVLDDCFEPFPGPGVHTYVVRARDESGNLSPPSEPLKVVLD
jgi:hypothetical protein